MFLLKHLNIFWFLQIFSSEKYIAYFKLSTICSLKKKVILFWFKKVNCVDGCVRKYLCIMLLWNISYNYLTNRCWNKNRNLIQVKVHAIFHFMHKLVLKKLYENYLFVVYLHTKINKHIINKPRNCTKKKNILITKYFVF